MLLFCGAPGFQAELAATFHSLVEDPHALVRRTIACGFHEVRNILTLLNLSFLNGLRYVTGPNTLSHYDL